MEEETTKPYEDCEGVTYEGANDEMFIHPEWCSDLLVAIIDNRRGNTVKIYESESEAESKVGLYDDDGYISVYDSEKTPVEAVIRHEAQYGHVQYLSRHVDIEKEDLSS